MVLSREWGNGLLGRLSGTLRHYHRDPFRHSLLRTRQRRWELGIRGLRVLRSLGFRGVQGIGDGHPGLQEFRVRGLGFSSNRSWDQGPEDPSRELRCGR